MAEIRTRFAPSPTGFLHIGGLRTALYSYAFAKNQGGKFVLRIEDTDRKRFVPGATEKIYEMLKIFGLNWDEGPYVQSERVETGIYQKYAQKLIEDNHAYYCDQEEGLKPAIRLRLPDNETISFHDFIIDKDISWETKNLDEVVLLKSDGFPTYHLAVVVDDAEMKISHVIRGHDWLPSTPIHLLLMDYLGFNRPSIGHLTDILDPEGGKLSKRKGAVSCEELLAEGYLPEAILNFVMLLGWAPKDNRELFTLEEFVENFQKGNLQISNPVFNREKLDWFNGVYLRKKSDEELVQLIKPFVPEGAGPDLIKRTIPLVKERITKLSDYKTLAGFFFAEPQVKSKLFVQNAKEQLASALEVLEKLGSWDKENIEKALNDLIKQRSWKTGEFFMNFRIAITGSKFTPPITDSVAILGKEKTLKRLQIDG